MRVGGPVLVSVDGTIFSKEINNFDVTRAYISGVHKIYQKKELIPKAMGTSSSFVPNDAWWIDGKRR